MALIPGDALHVDIFVTRDPGGSAPKPAAGAGGSKVPRISWMPGKSPIAWNPTGASSMEDVSLDSSRLPIQPVPPSDMDDTNSLLMPNPYGGMSGRYADGGLKGKDYDYEMAAGGQEESYDELDDTHFNGDVDGEINPEEDSFNRQLRQQGALRRKMTRKMTMGHSEQEGLWVDIGQPVGSPTMASAPDFPSPPASSDDHDHSDTETLAPKRSTGPTDPRIKKLQQRPSMSSMKSTSSMGSIRDRIMDVAAVQASLPKVGEGARGEIAALQFTDEEVEDMLNMTEYAWPGRPMWKKLIAEEADRAKGPMIVACCGPTQLSADIRKAVAAQLDIKQIREGAKNGTKKGIITCVTEEFDY